MAHRRHQVLLGRELAEGVGVRLVDEAQMRMWLDEAGHQGGIGAVDGEGIGRHGDRARRANRGDAVAVDQDVAREGARRRVVPSSTVALSNSVLDIVLIGAFPRLLRDAATPRAIEVSCPPAAARDAHAARWNS